MTKSNWRTVVVGVILALPGCSLRAPANPNTDPGIPLDDLAPASASGYRWPKHGLTVSVDPQGCNLLPSEVLGAAAESLGIWEGLVDLRFVLVPVGSQADITVQFGAIGGYYGVAAYPGPLEPSVTVRLSNAIPWTSGLRDRGEPPADLVTVLAHEVGHAIGLAHTGQDNLMATYYTGSHREFRADVAGIAIGLYGPSLAR